MRTSYYIGRKAVTASGLGNTDIPRAILSDVGGILVEDQWPLVARSLANQTSVSADRLEEVLRSSARELDLGRVSIDGFRETVCRIAGVSFGPRRFRSAVLDDGLKLIGENMEYMLGLRTSRQLQFVAVTNVGPETADALEERFKLSRLFSGFARSHAVGALKPAASIYQEGLRLVGFPPSQTLFVDDVPTYVTAAEALGIPSLLVPQPKALVPLLSSRLQPR